MATFVSNSSITKKTMNILLNAAWDSAMVRGVVMDSASDLAGRYINLKASAGAGYAITRMIRRETTNAAIAGFTTVLGDTNKAFASIPLTYVYSVYQRVRLAAAAAIIAGLDVRSPSVKLGCFATLTKFSDGELNSMEHMSFVEYELFVREKVAGTLFNDAGWKIGVSMLRDVAWLGGLSASWVDASAVRSVGKNAMDMFVNNTFIHRI